MTPAKLSDLQLSTCNRWQLPSGVVKLAIPHVLPFYGNLFPNTIVNDVEMATPPDYDFVCKLISFTGVTPGTLVQIQWPDGRYLSNPGLDFFSFVGTGRRSRLLSPHKFCPKSSKIKMNYDNSQVNSTSVIEMYFEGVILVDLLP